MQVGIVPWSTSTRLSVVLILTPVRRTEVFIISLVICDYPSTQEQSRVDRPRRLITAIPARLHVGMRAGQSFVICLRIAHEGCRVDSGCAAAMQRQQGGEGQASQDLPGLQGQEGSGRAQSRCRRGRAEASPGADVAGMNSVSVQMWQGGPSPGADVVGV